MIRIITAETKRYYEAKAEEAGRVAGLEHQLGETRDDVAMWKAQSEDYDKQLTEEREQSDRLLHELREVTARLDGQQAEFDRQLEEARKPVVDLLTDLLNRADHPVEGAEFRKELALRVLETWVDNLTPEDHNTPMGLILRVITDTRKPEERAADQPEPETLEAPAPGGHLPEADPKVVRQLRDAALLKGPDPFPGVG